MCERCKRHLAEQGYCGWLVVYREVPVFDTRAYRTVTLHILADENIPAVEHFFTADTHVQRLGGRAIGRAQLQHIDILLVRSVTRVDAALLSGTGVKFVGTATSGLDHIDQEYLSQRGIRFAYAPGSNANSVVEYVLAAVASIGDTLEKLLAGGVVGIVGYGHVGKAVAVRCDALGIGYRVFDPWLQQNMISQTATLEQVLDCDVVTLHPELTADEPWPSHHLLRSAELERLRPDSVLINASRGPVIDNTALLTLLSSGRRFSTVLDVWEGEPAINAALLERVTLGSAHIAGYSLDGKLLATRMLSDAVKEWQHHHAPALDSPAGFAPALLLPEGLSRAGQIRYLLQSRYDISIDDVLLRQAILGEQVVGKRAAQFDQLRKSYRGRRELAGSVVAHSLPTPADIETVRALGCIAVSTSDSE